MEKLNDICERMRQTHQGLQKELLPDASPDQHYQMAQGCRNPKILPMWLPEHKDDPAVKVSGSHL